MCEQPSIPDIFGSHVFNESVMKQRLAPPVYAAWKACIRTGTPLFSQVAGEIAKAMKDWAVEKGATHYTHWFQPMTGVTAEKHESFLRPEDGGVIMDFSGAALIRGEPDASAFPSGGLRATFEARGYTAWDPTSFAFIKGSSLYIPTCFFSYNGEALDEKTPLLRSMDELSREAVRVLRLMGDENTHRVTPSVGPEQEYFLISKELFDRREDLRLTGRTLFGAPSPKGQELEDHYFGSIPPAVAAFMEDLDRQLWQLGILSHTKHNEAAPCQHELAPIYTDANSACDANQLVMETMKTCALKHGLVCLLNEKPFAGLNGSGKHNNWSLITDAGENLFQPGDTPRENARFLLFLAAFIKGVDEYQDLLRCTAAYAGNDHRLGGQEAPPTVLSVYLGDELTAVVSSIIHGTNYTEPEKSLLRIGVDVLPAIPRDTSDRNRTSPLAFTGNKFEFRMPGASQSIAGPNIILNTILAEELAYFASKLEQAKDPDSALQKLICKAFTDHSRIIFGGNGYSEEWAQEAKRRGLCSLSSTPEALSAYISDKNVSLVTRHGIFSPAEFRARYEVHLSAYCKAVRTEARTMADISLRQIFPAASGYASDLARAITTGRAAGGTCAPEAELYSRISAALSGLYRCEEALNTALDAVPAPLAEAAAYYHDMILPAMMALRNEADLLERLTDKARWPFPTYEDLLFGP